MLVQSHSPHPVNIAVIKVSNNKHDSSDQHQVELHVCANIVQATRDSMQILCAYTDCESKVQCYSSSA
eukprot:14942-Heterococcus_DN1.PRE.9